MTPPSKTSKAFAALSERDKQSRTVGAGFGTEQRRKPGPKKDTRPKHKTSVSFLEEDWLLIRETAYQKRMTVTEALTVAAREYAERENITLPDSEAK